MCMCWFRHWKSVLKRFRDGNQSLSYFISLDMRWKSFLPWAWTGRFEKMCFYRTNISYMKINLTISPKNSLQHECLPFYAALTFMCYYSNDFSSACDMHNLWWCCAVKYRQFFINFPSDLAAILALWYLCFSCAIIYKSRRSLPKKNVSTTMNVFLRLAFIQIIAFNGQLVMCAGYLFI